MQHPPVNIAPAGFWRLSIMATFTSGIMRSRCERQAERLAAAGAGAHVALGRSHFRSPGRRPLPYSHSWLLQAPAVSLAKG